MLQEIMYMRSVKAKRKSMEQENASSSATNESKKPRKAWNLHSQEIDLCMSFATPKRGSLI